MASSSDGLFGLVASQKVVAPGATNAVFIDCVNRQGSVLVKILSGGGTLEIHGTPTGSTLAGASLAPLIGTGYLLGGSEVLSVDGPARFYLMATGATMIACLLKGLTAPGYTSGG